MELMANPEDVNFMKVIKLAESLGEEIGQTSTPDGSEIAAEIARAVHAEVQSPSKVRDVSASDLAVCLWAAAWLRGRSARGIGDIADSCRLNAW